MINSDPLINFVMPALKGRRLTVYDIVTKLYYEDYISVAIEDYKITRTDAQDAVDYCVATECWTDKNLVHYCDGCILRTISEGPGFEGSNLKELLLDDQLITVAGDGQTIFLGSKHEFEESEFRKVTWLMAEKIKSLLDSM